MRSGRGLKKLSGVAHLNILQSLILSCQCPFHQILHYFSDVFYQVTLGQSSPSRWFPPNLTQAENSANEMLVRNPIFVSFSRSEKYGENR